MLMSLVHQIDALITLLNSNSEACTLEDMTSVSIPKTGKRIAVDENDKGIKQDKTNHKTLIFMFFPI